MTEQRPSKELDYPPKFSEYEAEWSKRGYEPHIATLLAKADWSQDMINWQEDEINRLHNEIEAGGSRERGTSPNRSCGTAGQSGPASSLLQSSPEPRPTLNDAIRCIEYADCMLAQSGYTEDSTTRMRLANARAIISGATHEPVADIPRPVWSEALQDDIYYASEIDPYLDRLRAPSPPEHAPMAPIAKLIVSEDDVVRAIMYAPGLPPGEHDLYPEGWLPDDHRDQTITSLCDRIERIFCIAIDQKLTHVERIKQIQEWSAGFMQPPSETKEAPRELTPSEAASFDKTLQRSPRRVDPPGGYRDATGELVIPSRASTETSVVACPHGIDHTVTTDERGVWLCRKCGTILRDSESETPSLPEK